MWERNLPSRISSCINRCGEGGKGGGGGRMVVVSVEW